MRFAKFLYRNTVESTPIKESGGDDQGDGAQRASDSGEDHDNGVTGKRERCTYNVWHPVSCDIL